MIDTNRLSNPSLIQHSLNFLRTSRPQSGYTKTILDQSSFYTTHQQDEWNYQQFQTTQKKELYLDSFQLKTGYHQLQDDNLKIKSSIVKQEISLQILQKKIGLLKRQLADFKVLEQYAEPALKDSTSISPSKKKQNENNHIISILKKEITVQKNLIEQKTSEVEEIKKMLRTLDSNDIVLEKKILVEASIEYKERYDKVSLQNKVGTLMNDYQQLENIYQQKIRDLQKQNVNLSQIYAKEQEQTDKLKSKHNNSNQEIASLRRQIQEVDAHIKVVKQELVNNKLTKGKNEENKSSPQTPKEKLFIRQLESDKVNLITEKQELQNEYNSIISTETQKKQVVESQKNTYLNAIDEKKEQNQDIKEQLQIIREQNRELQMRVAMLDKGWDEAESDEGNDIQIKNFNKEDFYQNSTNQIESNLNKNSSKQLNGHHRKNSFNSQKSSDRDSLQYTQSKYGTATQQKVISNYSPFQSTNQKNHLLSTFKNSSINKVGLPEIQTQDQQEQSSSQKLTNKKTPSYPLINVRQASNNQDAQKQLHQDNNNNLEQIPTNMEETTPKTSKRLEFFYSSEAQRLSSLQKNEGEDNDQNIQPFIFNSESMKQLKKKELSSAKIREFENEQQNSESQSVRSSKNKKHLLGIKTSDMHRRQSENNQYSSSNFDDNNSEHPSSVKNSVRQLSLFQRLSEQKRVRKVSDMTSSVYSLNNDNIIENNSEMSERSARENICYVDIEREKFIDYLQKTINLEKECAKFENLIKNKELLTFPNPQNALTQVVLNQSAHNVVNTVFGFDSNCFNYDVRKQRVKSSLIIQDLIVTYLEDQSSKKSFQIRNYEIHKIVNEKKRFDHSMMLAVTLGLPHILKQISLNIIALPEISNQSFDFISQFQIGNKEVYKAIIKRTMQSCTLISFPIDTSHQLEMLLKEIELASIIDSSYILKPLCSYVDREESKYYLNIIYGSLIGNLEDFMEKYEVQEQERIKMCYQIALGIQDIHLQNYIHTQIRPDNIMITENFTPLIANMRESSYLSEQKIEKESQRNEDKKAVDSRQSKIYTYEWILTKSNSWQQKNVFTKQDLSSKYDFSFDIFSLGLIIYYILTQKQIPAEFNENTISSFEEIKSNLTGLENLPMDQQIIIKMCLEKQTSIQGILYRLRKLIDNSDIEEIHMAEQSLNMLVQEQTPETQTETFFEKGRLICPIENGVIDGVGMLFRSNNMNLKGNKTNFRNGRADKKDEDQTSQMECLISHFKGENIQGRSIYIRQNEPYIQYLRDQNDSMIYIFDSNTDELISCKLHQQLPCIKGELDEQFLDKLTDSKLLCTNHLVLPDKTELIRSLKTHTLILKKPGFGEIHYSPISIKYYLPNDDYIMVEKSKTYMYQSLSSSLNIVLPTQNCKEKIQLASKDYFFEFINVNPYYILTLSKKNNEKQPITVIFDGNFYLNTYLPAENSTKISNIQVNGGYLGFVINVKQNSVIFGIFKSPTESILLQGFKITNSTVNFLQDFDVRQQDSECQSPLKSVKRNFFSNDNDEN